MEKEIVKNEFFVFNKDMVNDVPPTESLVDPKEVDSLIYENGVHSLAIKKIKENSVYNTVEFDPIRVITNGDFYDSKVFYGDKQLPVEKVEYTLEEMGGKIILTLSPAASITIIQNAKPL